MPSIRNSAATSFKNTLDIEENKGFLLPLVNFILALREKVTDLTLRNARNPKNFSNGRLAILGTNVSNEETDKDYNLEWAVCNFILNKLLYHIFGWIKADYPLRQFTLLNRTFKIL